MANMSPIVLILILIVSVLVALAIGYFVGSRFGGKKSSAMKEAREEHDSYKNDVREHFEQSSAIMARMVDNYRDMYKHLSGGAVKLADIQPEKRVSEPPSPEAITRDSDRPTRASSARSTQRSETAASASSTTSNRDAVMRSDSSNDRPWNKEDSTGKSKTA